MSHIYCTGYVVPIPLWKRYLEEGHRETFNIPLYPKHPVLKKENDLESEDDSEDDADLDLEDKDSDVASAPDEQRHQEQIPPPRKITEEEALRYHEIDMFGAYKARFRRIRGAAPQELRTQLDIPYSFIMEVGDHAEQFMYFPTGIFIRRRNGSGSQVAPSDKDRAVITLFIDTANALLPDDDARARAGFSLAEMEFRVVPKDAVLPPLFTAEEYKEIKQLRMRQRSLANPASSQ